MRYQIAWVVGKALKITGCGYRFSKDYRHGATIWHRAVYAMFSTVAANYIADGRNWTMY